MPSADCPDSVPAQIDIRGPPQLPLFLIPADTAQRRFHGPFESPRRVPFAFDAPLPVETIRIIIFYHNSISQKNGFSNIRCTLWLTPPRPCIRKSRERRVGVGKRIANK